MKKIIFIFIILCIILLIPKEEKEVRVRIISNSDNMTDVNDKVIVKEALLKILKEYQFDNVDLFISKNIDIIKRDLQKELSSELFNKLVISYQETYFPPKELNGSFLAAGKYKTLLIEIDAAKGSNWWSVLYPSFFSDEYNHENEVQYKWYFIDKFK